MGWKKIKPRTPIEGKLYLKIDKHIMDGIWDCNFEGLWDKDLVFTESSTGATADEIYDSRPTHYKLVNEELFKNRIR